LIRSEPTGGRGAVGIMNDSCNDDGWISMSIGRYTCQPIMLHLIDVKCIQRSVSTLLHLKFIDHASLREVSSAKRLDLTAPDCHVLTCLALSVFLDFRCTNVTSCFKLSIFASSTAGRTKLRFFLLRQ